MAEDIGSEHRARRTGQGGHLSRSLLRRQPPKDSRHELSRSATTSPICPCLPTAPTRAAGGIARNSRRPALAAKDHRLWLHFGGINYRGEVWINGHKIADSSAVAGAYRTYDFDVTDVVRSGKQNVLAVKTTAPTEKDLGINWVDWNPCPPDKDMGLWGAVDLVETGPVTVRSPLAVTHFPDGASLNTADLTVYAELHNATGNAVKGVVSGTAARCAVRKAGRTSRA